MCLRPIHHLLREFITGVGWCASAACWHAKTIALLRRWNTHHQRKQSRAGQHLSSRCRAWISSRPFDSTIRGSGGLAGPSAVSARAAAGRTLAELGRSQPPPVRLSARVTGPGVSQGPGKEEKRPPVLESLANPGTSTSAAHLAGTRETVMAVHLSPPGQSRKIPARSQIQNWTKT